MTRISAVKARRVWDSRGRPTVEVDVIAGSGAVGRAIAPAGASTGLGEAIDLRDGGARHGGLDVTRAIASVTDRIAPAMIGRDVADQEGIDALLVALDGGDQMAALGGNATIAASMAAAHAAAGARGVPLWRHLAGDAEPAFLPLPEIQIFGGGAHAARRVDLQDFMVVAVGASDYRQALEWTAEVYRAAGKLLAEAGRLAGVADEGGYWPVFESNEDAIETLVRAIERARLRPGEDMAVSLDVAATQFRRDGLYRLARDGRALDSGQLIDMLVGWRGKYPIVSIEDPLAEDDVDGLAAATAAFGPRMQVVADDAAVTRAARVRDLAARGACNTVLVKPNQIGTLTAARAALEAARAVDWGAIVSARSGETEDVTIVHLAVGWGVAQLKVGSFARSERMAKWNEGLRIAEALACDAALPDRRSFPWGGA